MTDTEIERTRPPFLAWAVLAACLLALLGLAVTVVHLLWPSPLLFMLFMTLGQGSFGIAVVLYAIVILADLRHRKVL